MKPAVNRLLQLAALGVLLVSPFAPARAETLDEVLRDVVATNPVILEKQKTYNTALADLEDAHSAYFPKVIFYGNIGYKHWRDADTRYEYEDDGFYNAKLTLSQLLYDWGKTASYERARENYMLGTLYAYVGASSKVVYDTAAAYLDVLKYNELQALAMDNVLIHEDLVKHITLQVETGKKGRSELERVNGRLASAQARLLLRQNDYKKAVYMLHKMLGRFTPVDEMVMPRMDGARMPGSLKEAMDLQIRYNPLLRETFYNIVQKECEYENKKSDYMGRLSLEGSAGVEDEFDSSDDYEVDARIFLRYQHTLFDAGRSKRVQSAISQVHREQQKKFRVRRTLTNDLQLSWAAHKLLEEQIGVLKKNLYFASRSLSSYKQEFSIGKRSLINILDAQNEYQYVSEQLVNAIYGRELEKYKILHSQGVLLSGLGLLNPLVDTMIEKDSGYKYKPLSEDELPLNHDFDNDGIRDDYDISPNNRKGTQVNELGISKVYDSGYIYATGLPGMKEKECVIASSDDLVEKPLQMDVTTRFDFDAFITGSLELTPTMTDHMMKELVRQARTYSVQTPLYVTVSTNEYDTDTENYNLALKRAYNLKRILQEHRIENEGVFVFADTNAPRGNNLLRLKFTSQISDYKNQYLIRSVPARVFADGESRMTNVQEIDAVIDDIRQTPGKAEIVLYTNELSNKAENRTLSQQRAALLEAYLVKKGLGTDKALVFSWGDFRDDPLVPDARRTTQYLQYIIRDQNAR